MDQWHVQVREDRRRRPRQALEEVEHAGVHVSRRPSGAAIARRMGAHQVIDSTTTDVRTAVSGVDVVLDTVGGDVEATCLDVSEPGGLLLAPPVPPDAGRASARGVRAEFVVHLSDAERLATVVREVDAGLEILVDRIVPLGESVEALDVVAAGHACSNGETPLRRDPHATAGTGPARTET